MNILVLNGSPKGKESVTMQYVTYLEKLFPEHRFQVEHVARNIASLVKNGARFEKVMDGVRSSDGVLWAFPLYIMLVCSQYKRFIELIGERKYEKCFSAVYAASLSTSINFFDVTAHRYIHSVSEDLGMRFTGSYSAHMHDLLKDEERKRFELFARDFFTTIETGSMGTKVYSPLQCRTAPLDLKAPTRKTQVGPRKVVILTDTLNEQNLTQMVERFKNSFEGDVSVYDIYDLDIAGGCQGCLRCGAEYRCAYTGKDGFSDFYNTVLRPADIIVFAGGIRARQLSWKWRQFFDRSFFNTHTPSLTGKQIAFLISGPFSRLPDMRLVYEAWVEFQQSNLAGFVSDEGGSTEVEAALDGLARRLVRLSEEGYIGPRTFLSVGGMKIFRDDIWGGLRIIFRGDHRAYKRSGVYDFPHRKILRRILVSAAYAITGLPAIQRKLGLVMKSRMTAPYKKVIRKAERPARLKPAETP